MAVRWKMNQDRTAEALLRAGLDIKAMAAKIPEFSYRSVQAALHGDTAPRPSLIAAIASVLGVDPVSLCDKVEEPEHRGRKPKQKTRPPRRYWNRPDLIIGEDEIPF